MDGSSPSSRAAPDRGARSRASSAWPGERSRPASTGSVARGVIRSWAPRSTRLDGLPGVGVLHPGDPAGRGHSPVVEHLSGSRRSSRRTPSRARRPVIHVVARDNADLQRVIDAVVDDGTSSGQHGHLAGHPHPAAHPAAGPVGSKSPALRTLSHFWPPVRRVWARNWIQKNLHLCHLRSFPPGHDPACVARSRDATPIGASSRGGSRA